MQCDTFAFAIIPLNPLGHELKQGNFVSETFDGILYGRFAY